MKATAGLAQAIKSKMHGPSISIMVALPKGDKAPPYPPAEEEEDEEEEQDDTPEEQDNRRIVSEAMRALDGKLDHPEVAINEFIATFGKERLDELKKMVKEGDDEEPEHAARGRLIEGPGRGMADRIKAMAGTQPVLLSDGEYVVPADVVSHLGDGSTRGGVRELEAMIERVRRQKTGSNKQAKPIADVGKLLGR